MTEIKKFSEILTNKKNNFLFKEKRNNIVMTGFEKLDEILGGMDGGSLIALGGRTAMGKTALAINIAKNNVEKGNPVLFISLESTSEILVGKFLSSATNISFRHIRNNQLTIEEWREIDTYLNKINNWPLYIDCRSVGKIDELCKDISKVINENKIKLVIIDYLQLLYTALSAPSDNRYGDINYFTRRLKSLAKELNIPILLISQLNRNLEKDNGLTSFESYRPKLTDLRDSGTICDDSDVVMFIYRSEYYHIYEDEKGNDMHSKAEIIVAKNRLGYSGGCIMKCDLNKISFSDNLTYPNSTSELEDIPVNAF